MKRSRLALMVALLVGTAAGCSVNGDEDGDKAGGSEAPQVLRLASANDSEQPDAPFARYFADRVRALSGGSLRVRVVWDAAGTDTPGYELGIARLVHDGDFELGWMGARAWDRMDINSFQALQAPFLVTNHELLNRITTGPLAARMLGGLDGHGFVGLALVPEHLRYAFGATKALTSPDDFAGARVRVQQSRATDALMRALGATPAHISEDDVPEAVANGEIDGAEASLGTKSADEGESHLTLNLPLFPKTLTLFAGEGAYDRLDEGQREVIRKAAQQTAAHAARHARVLQPWPARERGPGKPGRRRRARGRRAAGLHPARARSADQGIDRGVPRSKGHDTRATRRDGVGELRGGGAHRARSRAGSVCHQRHLSLAYDRDRSSRGRACGRAPPAR